MSEVAVKFFVKKEYSSDFYYGFYPYLMAEVHSKEGIFVYTYDDGGYDQVVKTIKRLLSKNKREMNRLKKITKKAYQEKYDYDLLERIEGYKVTFEEELLE